MATPESHAGLVEADVVPQGTYRAQYENKCELLLVLVGYAVGLGNIWRFPSLTFDNGGGAFLIPYVLALVFLGLPLFILELGLGQIFRKGTMHVWEKMGAPRLRCIGVCATICSYLVSLYYCVILAWTIFYIAQVVVAVPSGVLPWEDTVPGFVCPDITLEVSAHDYRALGHDAFVHNGTSFRTNEDVRDMFSCNWNTTFKKAVKDGEVSVDMQELTVSPSACPSRAAVMFWNDKALQKTDNMFEFGGLHWGMFASYTAAWILTYFCVFQGVASSGKIVYFTAILPYVALLAFFFRAVTLENAGNGIYFYLKPDFSLLLGTDIWIRAITQIFYSLGVGFGSLIAFASYSDPKDDFVGNAVKVSFINCGTSFFGGFAVFPVLGFLAAEMANVNPCFQADNIDALRSIGLSGSGLAFIAFPIAISKMPFPFFWAMLFFLMLLCLGIDSQFAMVESVITVLNDAGIGKKMPKPMFAAVVCGVSWLLGIIFVTRAGIYWFNLFDYYTCVVALFVVCFFEIVGVLFIDRDTWTLFKTKFRDCLGYDIPAFLVGIWSAIPVVLVALFAMAFKDIAKLQGEGYFPLWSSNLWGWIIGLLPVAGFALTFCLDSRKAAVPVQRPAGAVEMQGA